MAADFSIFLETNGILAMDLQLANKSVSMAGFFNLGRTCDVFSETGKLPLEKDYLTIPPMKVSVELMVSLKTCMRWHRTKRTGVSGLGRMM